MLLHLLLQAPASTGNQSERRPVLMLSEAMFFFPKVISPSLYHRPPHQQLRVDTILQEQSGQNTIYTSNGAHTCTKKTSDKADTSYIRNSYNLYRSREEEEERRYFRFLIWALQVYSQITGEKSESDSC